LPFDAQLCGFDVAGVGVAILGVALIVLVLRMLLAQAVARDVRSRADAGRVGRGDLMPIAVDIDVMLARRKMSADRVGITPANLAVLKNGRAKAVRFSTLAALCEELNWQPGDLLRWENANVPAG
jgi:putative transcriptional regulator